jgi:hypothetical protein
MYIAIEELHALKPVPKKKTFKFKKKFLTYSGATFSSWGKISEGLYV